jgi:FkbM family methyltransferase
MSLTSLLKWVAARCSTSTQHELRRWFFRHQIRTRRFLTDEREYALLDKWLEPGDWAMDIGANVGQYTLRMSELVGPSGRVIAIEPVPDTFALLAANTRSFPHANVTLLNAAVSDRTTVVGMKIPSFAQGLPNYYQAQISEESAGLTVLGIPLDALGLTARLKLVKMDVEGHELPALKGMRTMLERDHPVLLVETSSDTTVAFLESMGYATRRLPGSSNLVCESRASGTMQG